MASQTLVQRLGSAFWQAFSGSSPSPSSPSSASGAGPSMTQRVPAWDADKVRRVLEGTAVVRVVDVELSSSPSSPLSSGKAATVAAKAAAKEAKEVQTQAQQPACANFCATARETGLGVLEESMRALTLGKK